MKIAKYLVIKNVKGNKVIVSKSIENKILSSNAWK